MDRNPFGKWLLAPLLVLGGCNDDMQARTETCVPRFEDGWIRSGPTAMPMMGGFGRLENPCTQDVAVVATTSDRFADVSLHRTINEGGMSRMRPVSRLVVEAGTTEVLEPGGLHLMLMQPSQPLQPASKVSVVLKLEDGRELPAELVVRAEAP